MGKKSRYQQQAIRNYYKNRDAIAIQRLQELVTELYLAEGRKRKQQWDRVAKHLEKLEIPASRIQHLVEQDRPELVAQLVEKLLERDA